MTSTQNGTAQETLMLWWQAVQTDFPMVVQLVERGIEIAEHDFEGALGYVEAVRRHIAHPTLEPSCADAQRRLLKVLDHLIAALRYAINGDDFQCQTRCDMAQAALDSLRLSLLQQNIVA